MKENKFNRFAKRYYKNINNNHFFKFKENKSNQNPLSSKITYEQLKYIKTLEEHSQTINDMIALEDVIYLTNDNNKYYISNANKEKPCYKEEELGNNSKINKIIYSAGKLIYSLECSNQINGIDEKEITNKLLIIINNDNNNTININTRDKPTNILEIGNAIITCGKKYIELFQFTPYDVNPITTASEIIYNESNDEIYQITCIIRFDKKLICGHASGHISYWAITKEYPFLKNILLRKIHISKINTIITDTNNNIISVSSDKTLKVHSLEDNICFKVIDFQDEVMDIKKVEDLENKIKYIISLKNGMIEVYNSEFQKIFIIPNRTNIIKTRYVLSINNSSINNDNNKEKYVLITEDNKIDLYKWDKNEEIEIEIYKRNYNYNKKFNRNKMNYNKGYKFKKKY